MGVGLSTSWNAFRCKKGQNLIDEIKALGFQEIELSFNLTFKLVKEIADSAGQLNIRIVSLHNYCPIPEDLPPEEALPDCYSLASINEEERKKALHYTKRTIDTANMLGAKIVVLHLGRVEMPDATKDLIAIYLKGGKNTKEFRGLKNTFLKDRDKRAKPFFENALRSLEELSHYARDNDIGLGIENRFYYREIPSFQEISVILNKFKGSPLNYWHDTGHAHVMESLGIVKQKDYLDCYAQDMFGIHIHNVLDCRDHRAPQQGEIDFKDFTNYLNKNILKIIEAHQPASAEEVKEGKKYIETLLNGNS